MVKRAIYKNNEKLVEVDFNQNEGPKKTLKINLNRFIIVVMSLLFLSFIVIYSLVVNTENSLMKLHSKTAELQAENVEMKAKVEFSKSLYNVQGKAETISFLHKPEKVIEVDAKGKDLNINLSQYSTKKDEKVLSGY